MISSKTAQELIHLLSEIELKELISSIAETFGNDVGSEIDKNQNLQRKINHFIYQYVHSKHPDKTDKVLFDVNESVVDLEQTQYVSSEPVPLLKDFVYSNDHTGLASETLNSVIQDDLPTDLAVDNEKQKNNSNNLNDSKNSNIELNQYYNLILDGRSKLNILLEKHLSGVDDVAREIIIKCFLIISVFVALISLIMVLMNTSNINQIQEMYNFGHKSFLFQYAEVCGINVELAKGNPCVVSELNNRISELSNSRFWNSFGLVFFSVLACFFFYHISTYRDSKDKKYN